MQVLCSEAELAPDMPVARKALEMLWEDVIAVQAPSGRPGHDAIIVRNLIRLMTGLLPRHISVTKLCESVESIRSFVDDKYLVLCLTDYIILGAKMSASIIAIAVGSNILIWKSPRT